MQILLFAKILYFSVVKDMKKLDDLTKEELIAIKNIVNNYPLTSKIMLDVKKNPEYTQVIEIVKAQMKKQREFNEMIDKEMQTYKSPVLKLSKKHKSLSYKHQTYRKSRKNRSAMHLSKKKLNKSPSRYIDSQEYKEYEEKYKQYISPRSKSLTTSSNASTTDTFDEEYAIHNLISYMHKYFYPGNMIRYLSMLDKRFCDLNEGTVYTRFIQEDNYSCESIHNNIFLYNFLHIIDIKCLYICYHKGKHYISPLNDRLFLKFIQKRENLPHENMLDKSADMKMKFSEHIRRSLDKMFVKFRHAYDSDSKIIDIPCQLYDLVIKHNMFHYDFEVDPKFEVKLSGINNKHFVSSIINNKEHSISIVKLKNKTYFSPSLSSGIISETYRVYNYVPLFNKHYDFQNDAFSNLYHKLMEVDVNQHDVRDLYSSRFMFGLNKSIYAYTADNLHFFSNRHQLRKQKRYVAYTGGNGINLVIPPNKNSFCWYLSIISSLFYADEIGIVILNKSVRYIKRYIDILQKYNVNLSIMKTFTSLNYAKYANDKEHIINIMVYINAFVYTSYACLMKQQLQQITDKKNWLFCLNYIFENEKLIRGWNDTLLALTRITSKCQA